MEAIEAVKAFKELQEIRDRIKVCGENMAKAEEDNLARKRELNDDPIVKESRERYLEAKKEHDELISKFTKLNDSSIDTFSQMEF